MYIPRLDEFELKQIDKLLELLDEKVEIIQAAKGKAELMEDEMVVDDIIKSCDEDVKIFVLWWSQLKNARAVVREKGTGNKLMKTFTIKHEPSPYFTSHGWGNGYVIIPEGHPLHGKGYDDIHNEYDIDMHGGLTFSESAKTLKEENWLPKEVDAKDTDWIIGFDTAHYGDSMQRWPDEKSVLKEAERLVHQIENLTVNS